jgi:hypothetical protein
MAYLYRASLLLCLFSANSLANTIVAYVEAPTIQSTSVSGVTTSTFDGLSTGNYSSPLTTSIGVYEASPTDQFEIHAADQYGGAGGTGNFFAIGSDSGYPGPLLLNLDSQENYFGFWWSAGDANNSISFLENGTVLATFTTANLVSLLPNTQNGTVTAINGSVYNTKNYYGNPNDNQDTNEPFAYVDIIANGITFNQVSFSNTLATGFESDNHSVAYGVTAPPSGDVIIENVPLTAAGQTQVPEPGTALLLLGALGGLGVLKLRRN